jgi:hypothetical protein
MLFKPPPASPGASISAPTRFADNYDPAAHDDRMSNLRPNDLRRRGPFLTRDLWPLIPVSGAPRPPENIFFVIKILQIIINIIIINNLQRNSPQKHQSAFTDNF